jgi:mRNA-degrading endonuclease YafQ of YafQ-DinJ toxin-antitoxin module
MSTKYIEDRNVVVLKKNKKKVLELLKAEEVDVLFSEREWRGHWTYINYCNVKKDNKLANSIGDLSVQFFSSLDEGRDGYENGRLQKVIKLLKEGARVRPFTFEAV